MQVQSGSKSARGWELPAVSGNWMDGSVTGGFLRSFKFLTTKFHYCSRRRSLSLPPKGAIVQVGSKFDVRPSSVRGVTPFQRAQAHLQETDPLFGHLDPYLVPERDFVFVSFWVILAQRI